MSDGFYSITINTRTFYPDQIRSGSEWQAALQAAKTNGHIPKCGCNPGVENLLVIRRHQGSSEYYGLARYPKKGYNHNPQCRFHADKPELSGMQGYTADVVEELDDGNFKIRLDLDRQVRELGRSNGEENLRVSTGMRQPQKRAMQLLGLLHFLFNQGCLNAWHPSLKGKRTWSVVAQVLSDVSGRINCCSAKLNTQLLLGITVDFNKSSSENQVLIKEQNDKNRNLAESKKQRLVAIVMLKQYDCVKNKNVLPLSQWEGLPYMQMNEDMWHIAQKQFPLAWSAWRRGDPVCAIVRLQYIEEPFFPGARKMKKDWRVVDIALQALSDEVAFIPVESSYESVVARKLVKDGRNFTKPLRFEAGEDEVFPDFILLDTSHDKYPMEVFGRTDESYEKREVVKRNYYRQHFGEDWWCWKAGATKDPPEFPAKTR